MRTPERSAALARVLASEADGLPQDFAARVAALAELKERRQWSWNDLALVGAFVAMIGVCIAGWLVLGPKEPGSAEWVEPVLRAVASQPWIVIGIVGVAIGQMLTFRRRAST